LGKILGGFLMSDEEKLEEENQEEERSVEVSDESDEEDEDLEYVEDEEVDEALEEEEEGPEKGAVLVIGQGDFEVNQSNRGADDPGDNTLNEPQFITKFGEMLFISDRGNHRVLVWDQIPEENGDPASVVIGQEDFADCLENRGITTTLDEMTSGLGDESLDGFTISQCEEDTIAAPAGLDVIDGKLYVSDSGNHRVLRWEALPSEDGEAPGLVMGQDNLECNEANRRGVISSASLFFPMGIRSGDDQHVFVADKDNHRVLIWDKIPFNNGWNSDISLGQGGMDEREPNRGDFEKCGPDTLSFPTGVFYHAEEDKLFVVDQGNNRVLIWNKLPREVGAPADLVLGQKDFYSREVNGGVGSRIASNSGFYFPTDIVYGRKGLFVSDSSNNRIMVWTELPTENGQPADLVIGQSDFVQNKFNRNSDITACSLNDPYGLYLDEDPEDEEDTGRLYICDRGNSRVVVWDELPVSPSISKEDEEEDPDKIVYESEELMGNDDDFMDDDDDDPPHSVPVT
jgi:hypothetical protein